MNHFTNQKGWNAIRATTIWVFKAKKQRGGRPRVAYFTTLDLGDPRFFRITRLPVAKRTFVFRFIDADDLIPRAGPLGQFVFYSPKDYPVTTDRQRFEGPA